MEEKREKIVLSPKQWIALGVSCLCGGMLVFGWRGAPGLGFAAILLAVQAMGLWLSAKKCTRGGIFTVVCAALMAASYAIFGNVWMKILNLPLTLALTAQSLFALAGHHEALSAQGVRLGVRRTLMAAFGHMNVPVRALADLRDGKGRFRGLGLGLAVTLPLLAVVTLLLGSADAVFGDMLLGATKAFHHLRPGPTVWKTIWALIWTLMIFSFLYALTQPPREIKARAKRDVPALTCLMTLTALCAVEMLFVYVQVRYLFGGAETAAMEGGYAQYARSGFFEMVAVAGVNLTVVLWALSLRGDKGAVRMLCAWLCALTGVILVSAAWRMRLYILAYGMTLLRLLTLWAMAMIALMFLLALVKCLRPEKKICAYMLAAVMAGWVLLNYVNVDACIARYNVHAYASGALEQLDVEYLSTLSADVLPHLPEKEAADVRERMTRQWVTFFSWNLSDLKLND